MTSEAKHTPGTWLAAAAPFSVVGWPIVASPQGTAIASVHCVSVCPGHVSEEQFAAYREECAANAHLISAAPQLLEALKDTLRMLEAAHRQLGMYTKDNPRIIKARAALAKATGAQK